MKKRVLEWTGSSMTFILAVVLVIPFSRYFLFGIISNERFDDGRPKRYWIDALKHADPEVRAQGAASLARMGSDAADAAPALIEALDDEAVAVRAHATFALFKLRVPIPEAVPKLIAGLQGENPIIRFYSSMCLSRIGPEAEPALPALMEAVKDKQNGIRLFPSDINTRQLSTVALGYIGPRAQPAVPLLIQMLRDDDFVQRIAAVHALGRIRSSDSVASLLTILQDESNPLRLEATMSLGRMGQGAEAAIPVLCKMMNDKNDVIRHEATTAVRQIDPRVATGGEIRGVP